MKTILTLLLLTGLALSAQTPPGNGAPAAPIPAPVTVRETNAAPSGLPAFPAPTPGQRRVRGVETNRPAASPGLPGALPAATVPGANPPATPPAAPAAGLPAPGAAKPAATPSTTPAPVAAVAEEVMFAPKTISYTGAELGQVLQKYAELIGRNLLRAPTAEQALKTPIFFVNQTPLTRTEAMQAYQVVLAMNGVSLVEVGEKFLKVVTSQEATATGQKPVIATSTNQLPEMGQFVTYIVQLKYAKPAEMVPVLTPFQSGKIANAIFGIEGTPTLVLRDFTENVKRMLEMIEKVDIGVPSEFESEVIPIKFAKAEEIASALSSLSGSGTTTTVGTRATSGSGGPSGIGTRPGMGGYQQGVGGMTTPSALGTVGSTGTPSGGGSFSDRINQIINRAAKSGASGSGDFQIIGPNKIVADVRSNSLMVFASHGDMQTIKKIIDQLDVVLAQVLIETVIMDVSLSDSKSFGLSYLQKPQSVGNLTAIGGLNNVGFLSQNSFSALTNGVSSLGGGLSYFGRLGQDLDVTLTALAGDSSVKVIQKPRIMTSHATMGSIFIGSTVPYVSSTYYGGGYGGGPSSSYQQLRVGINLQVTPYVNQDGLVVMHIDEAIDELGKSVPITGVGDVPSTVSRTLSGEVAVQDRETIVLGGFIRSSGSEGRSGVPILKDIPLLGMLFNKTEKSKDRSELMVLMRPTVLRTPELAARHTADEKSRLPLIRKAEAENAAEESKRIKGADKELGPSRHAEVYLPGSTPGTNAVRDAKGFLPPPQ